MNCFICHRPLTAAASIARNVGPECAATYAARVEASGSTPARVEQLAALDAPQVNRWLRLASLAISACRVRDARQFLAAAESAVPIVETAAPPVIPCPVPASPVSREIVIRRDDRGRFTFCPPWKDAEFISDFKRRVGRPFRTWNDRSNQWEVTPVDDQMAEYVAGIIRRHFAHYRVTIAE